MACKANKRSFHAVVHDAGLASFNLVLQWDCKLYILMYMYYIMYIMYMYVHVCTCMYMYIGTFCDTFVMSSIITLFHYSSIGGYTSHIVIIRTYHVDCMLPCLSPFSPLLQVVSEKCSEEIQCCCLSLLHLATEHSITAYLEFQQHGGMALIQQVLRTPQAAVGHLTLKVCMHVVNGSQVQDSCLCRLEVYILCLQ